VSLWTIELAEDIRPVEALDLSKPCPLLLSMATVVAVVEAMVPCDCASSVDGAVSKIWKRSLHTEMIEFGTLSV
jgi:hypothetical protein